MNKNIENNINYQFAKIITKIYTSQEVKNYKDIDDYNNKLNRQFKLDQKKYEHGIIESCRFLIEDTEMAIINFIEYGIQGPTKYSDNGEYYLRLYGLLNAIYLQISIPLTLIEVFKLDESLDRKLINDDFNDLKIVDFRHKIGAHTLNYKKQRNSNYYRIAQRTLDDREIMIVNKESTESINIIEEIHNYRSYYYTVMYNVINIIIDKLFEGSSKKYHTIKEYLEMIYARSKEKFRAERFDEDWEIDKLIYEMEILKNQIDTLRMIKKNKKASV